MLEQKRKRQSMKIKQKAIKKYGYEFLYFFDDRKTNKKLFRM